MTARWSRRAYRSARMVSGRLSSAAAVKLRAVTQALIVASSVMAGAAYAADAGDIAEGMRLYTQKANCQVCHGWAGDGRKMDNQMPTGANLRESKLDRAAFVMVVKCGLP